MMSYVKVYYDCIGAVSKLSDAEAGRLFKAILAYGASASVELDLSGREGVLFAMLQAQIDRDRATYEEISAKRSAAGSLGGSAKAKQMLASAGKRKQKAANASKCLQDKDKDKDDDKDKDEDTNCAERGCAASPPVISLILCDKSEYGVTEAKVARWRELYPGVDVMCELRKMAGWLEANPSRRKTRAGIERFAVSWLGKAQDKGGSIPAPIQQARASGVKPHYNPFADMARDLEGSHDG